MVKKVLIIDTVHPILVEQLEHAGFVLHDKSNATRSEIEKVIGNYHGVVLRSRINLNKVLIDAAVNLEFIARVGAGMESIDVAYAQSKGIVCFNSPEGNRDAVAEHCVGMLLSLSNNLCRANLQVRAGEWLRESNRGFEIKGKTLGIIGYGNMGSAFAQRLLGFGCKIIAYDKYKYGFGSSNIQECEMNDLFEQCDILSLHVPLTNETHYLVNAEFINNFKKPFLLINSARGPVVKTNSLVGALESGKILGAALDVIEYEDFSFEYTTSLTEIPDFKKLCEMDQVIMSPHIAGWTHESKYKLAAVLAEKIILHYK
jgi:D-3-phosphoglycerate dehydrogenase